METPEQPSFRDMDVAIIGMACRFPGARTPAEFWDNLRHGRESIVSLSREELLAAKVDAASIDNPNYVRASATIPGIDTFDAAFFGLSPREAEVLDPQQRVLLECAWEALEDAGCDPENLRQAVGVYAGCSMSSYLFNNLSRNREALAALGMYQIALSNDKDFLPTRISYRLNLRGPSVAVQTACSTGLVAVHLACQSLLNGECDMALAGGVSIAVPQNRGYLYQEGGIHSPDGHCRAFDAGAQGTVKGNGAGLVVLKRLADAAADGDHVYAVIKGSSINNDGALKVGYTAPSIDGQAAVITEAMGLAEVPADTIGFVEGHGTGTALGDPIEVAALTQAFRKSTARRQYCALGSVKTNIGHLDSAAGIAGLIKATLALAHREIPPTVNFERPNPKIDFQNSPFFVNPKALPWEANGHPRRAGVSSFGIGGTNAHVVLEESPRSPAGRREGSREPETFVFSARTDTALETMGRAAIDRFRQAPDVAAADIAHTLQSGRRHFEWRQAVVCRTVSEAADALESANGSLLRPRPGDGKRDLPVFMFPGQGAQYAGMGQGLYAGQPEFRRHVDVCATMLEPVIGLDLRSVLYPAGDRTEQAREQIGGTLYSQLSLFVVEYALAKLWASWGVTPVAMIGHSIGEYTAACLAGVFALEDALRLVAKRGQLMQALPEGAMLSVPCSHEQLQPYLGADLDLAADNGDQLCVASGGRPAIARLKAELARAGIQARELEVAKAFHSRLVEPALEPFAAALRGIKLAPPAIPFVSNVTGTWISEAEATDPGYWVSHLRGTVRFRAGIDTLAANPRHAYLEMGPGRTLCVLGGGRIGPATGVPTVRSPKETADDQETLLRAAARFWVGGGRIDWAGVRAGRDRRKVSLPTYPFERQRFWIEPAGGAADAAGPEGGAGDPQAPGRMPLDQWFHVPSWRRAPVPAASARQDGGRRKVVVFADAAGLGAAIRGRMEAEGAEVATVEAGGAYAANPDRRYVLDPAVDADYRRLFQELQAADFTPSDVVHLWTVGATAGDELGADTVSRQRVLGFDSLLKLARAIDLPSTVETVGLHVVAEHLHDVTGDEVLAPGKAMLTAAATVIPQEFPALRVKVVDLPPAGAAGARESGVASLFREMDAACSEPVVAYRNGSRWIRRFDGFEGGASSNVASVADGDAVLITGGLGKIGLLFAEHLARKARVKLLLVGRSPFPAKETWGELRPDIDAAVRDKVARLQAIEASGSEVWVGQADVADAGAVQRTVAEMERRFGRVDGVIHAAGVVGASALSPIVEPDAGREGEFFGAKVDGLLALGGALERRELKFVVLFSSVAVVLGGFGFARYAAANAFMDTFACERRRRSGQPYLSVNSDAWSFNAVDSDPQAAKRPGLGIRPADAAEVFDRILAHAGYPQVVVSTGDLGRRMQQARSRRPGRAAPGAGTVAALHMRPAGLKPIVPPSTETEKAVVAIWQGLLGIGQIGVTDSFFELGGHSLLAVRAVSTIREHLQVEIPMRVLMDDATPEKIAEYIDTVRWASGGAPAAAAGEREGGEI